MTGKHGKTEPEFPGILPTVFNLSWHYRKLLFIIFTAATGTVAPNMIPSLLIGQIWNGLMQRTVAPVHFEHYCRGCKLEEGPEYIVHTCMQYKCKATIPK
jgi:hypothetical protein